MLENVKIVLVRPSHPGNIGATARAMKTMACQHLCLVNPALFPHHIATARAAGADDILENASIVSELPSAIGDCHQVYATSARTRRLSSSVLTARDCAISIAKDHADRQVAIVFGNERSGLTNAELSLCHAHIMIPTVETFSSLNLAAAVQVLVYELFNAAIPETTAKCDQLRPMISENKSLNHKVKKIERASSQAVLGLHTHLIQVMQSVKFLNTKHPRRLIQRMHRLLNRAQLETNEIHILRGFLTAVEKACKIIKLSP